MIISISGPDGSGKSSLAKLVTEKIGKTRRVKVLHIDKYFLIQPLVSKTRSHVSRESVFSYKQKPNLYKLIVLIALFDSYLHFFYLKLLSLLGLVVICDRYFYDKLIGFNLHGYSNDFLNRIFLKLIPKPDFAFILTLDSKVAAAREINDKHDLAFHKKIGEIYRSIFEKIFCEQIDAKEDLSELAEEVYWRTKKIVVATHVYADGPAQALVEYLESKRVGDLIFIEHPLFPNSSNFGSSVTLSRISKTIKLGKFKFPQIAHFFYDFMLNLLWSIRYGVRAELYVGSDSLNALAGIVLKKMGLVNRTIYYVVDYQPVRFKNKLLNKIFHKIESFSAKHSDETWNLSKNMITARNKMHGVSFENQKLVPMGAWISRITKVPFEKCNKNQGVFVGHITENRGLQLVVAALPKILNQDPDFKLLVIGDGPYLPEIKKLAESLRVSKNINFKGFVEKHSDIEKLVAKSALAFATYKPEKDSFSYYADPGKIKLYLSCGVPVAITDVSYIVKDLKENNFGIVTEYDSEKLANVVSKLLKENKTLEAMRINASEYGLKFDWSILFSELAL